MIGMAKRPKLSLRNEPNGEAVAAVKALGEIVGSKCELLCRLYDALAGFVLSGGRRG